MTDRPRYPRSTCCVLGCHRWSTVFPAEWMCRDHWMSLPALLRKLLRRAWRRTPYTMRAHRAAERLWRRAKRIATEKAAGL